MDKLLYALGVGAMGMLVVFAGLVILICFIKILGLAINAGKKKLNAESAPSAPAPVAAPEPAPVQEDGVSPEVIAAITAAIAAMWEGPTGFRVHHVRRISNAPAWNRAGREEQIYSHF